jgi:predicted transcriptional regulator
MIKRRPGRPRVVRPQPDHDEAAYVEKLAELARATIDTDSVVRAMEDHGANTTARLDVIIRSLAEEQAGLLFEREKLTAEARADGIPQLCSRRIDCLMKLARLVIERELLRRQRGEMDDATVLKLVGMLVDKAEEVVGAVAPEHAMAFKESLRAQVAGASWSTSGPG